MEPGASDCRYFFAGGLPASAVLPASVDGPASAGAADIVGAGAGGVATVAGAVADGEDAVVVAWVVDASAPGSAFFSSGQPVRRTPSGMSESESARTSDVRFMRMERANTPW